MYLKDHSKPSYEIDMPFLEIENNSQNSIPHHFGLSNIVHMLNQKGQKKNGIKLTTIRIPSKVQIHSF